MSPSTPENDPASGNNPGQPAQVAPGCGCAMLFATLGVCVLLMWLLPKFGFQDQQEVGMISFGVFVGGALLGIFLNHFMGWLIHRAQHKAGNDSFWHTMLTAIPIIDDPGPPD
jgi:hypothetical protein